MNNNKQQGEETMKESYKDKFNAQMKKAGIDSLGDLKTDAEKKAFFKAVDAAHTAKNESVTEELTSIAEETINEMMSTEMAEMMKEMATEMKMLKAETDPSKCEMMKKEMMMKAMKKMPEMSEMMKKEMMKKMNEYGSMNAMKEELTPAQKKLPAGLQKAIAAKGKKKEETKDAEEMEEEMKDLEPNAEMLKAMVKDPHKSKEGDPKDDILAQYDDTQVKADVAKKGGADMSKVQDAPKMMTAMKKISAMYKTEKYHETKPGSLNDTLAQMHLNEQKSVSVKVQEFSPLVETYLAKGGVVGNISEAVKQVELNKSLRLNELREFITTYNLHFLTNYVAEEFVEKDLKEYTGMSVSRSVNSNDVATALKNLKKGTKLYVQGKPQGGLRTMGDVISVSGNTVKIKPTASNGPTSVNVKDITMMDTLKG